jgi:hypothetical protein
MSPQEPTDEELLRTIAEAAAELLSTSNPYAAPEQATRQDDWPHPIALNWQLQLRTLWFVAFDAFEVTSFVLANRASPSVLGQVRLLIETHSLVRWLAGEDDRRGARAYGLALSEIRDMKGVFSHWDRPERKEAISSCTKMEADLKGLAAEKGVRYPHVPGWNALVKQYSTMAHGFLSDVGSHAGLTGTIAFFGVFDSRTINIDPGGSWLQRAYFLGMAYELYAATSADVAKARGWDSLGQAILRRHRALGPTLREPPRRLEARAAPEESA